ncbi:MAG: ATP-dependent DNA helicase RecG [Bacilli bacterium]
MDLNDIKGIGFKTIKQLNKLNIFNTSDLLNYFPYRYDIIKVSDLNNLKNDYKIIVDGLVLNIPHIYYINHKLDKMTFQLKSNQIIFNVTIFNRGFLKQYLSVNKSITVIGKYQQKNDRIIASEIILKALGDKLIIKPIYHKLKGISNNFIHKRINDVIKQIEVTDYIPSYLVKKYKFLAKKTSLLIIHNPTDLTQLKQARIRLKYEELFIFMLKINNLKKYKENKLGIKRNVAYEKVNMVIKKLPFCLTTDQLKAIKIIYNNLTTNQVMNRLLQGDVGSGKTIVSFLAIFINYLANYQSALMAPTELLAQQHYNDFLNLFSDYNIKCTLLTGKTTIKNKQEIYEQLKNGKIDVIIGTHSLISESVKYYNLGLVITDEQHRFGVRQRENFKNKGKSPDVLYMSATPIPRTYAITLYGDMDISSIKTMPIGRKKIKTWLINSKRINDVFILMKQELIKNHQIYVVAPLIEEKEKITGTDVYKLEQTMNVVFGDNYNIGILHGQMSGIEKVDIMTKFKKNILQILISTTVIEVGIDVKNATVIIIFDSFRFGLSTIHQLRGRVGRNEHQSYCILISDKETKRLDVLTKTFDGFKISEADFKLRGSGEIFGIKQSGDMNFYIADIKKDYDLVLMAKEDSEMFINDRNLLDDKNSYILKKLENIMEIS